MNVYDISLSLDYKNTTINVFEQKNCIFKLDLGNDVLFNIYHFIIKMVAYWFMLIAHESVVEIARPHCCS